MGNKTHTNSWGRLDRRQRSIAGFKGRLETAAPGSFLPFGNGRSYGDSCHNDEGTLLDSRGNDPALELDAKNGLLSAGAGVLLGDILQHLIGTDWFLPVLPGTRYVTLGGAIANDIHGKNHGHRGTFGCHVREFTLVTSDGKSRICSPEHNSELFAATIGGMGLTGVITNARIALMAVSAHEILETNRPFASIEEFIDQAEQADRCNEYSVAWIDSLARGKAMGRGILITGSHAPKGSQPTYNGHRASVPFTPPIPLVAGWPLRAFNMAYYLARKYRRHTRMVQPGSFFFPLDSVGNWNRLYGPHGLFQHQSVLPSENAAQVLKSMLAACHDAGQGSFLTVLKRFGSITSPGLLSFPKPGYTLTLDFPNRGEKTTALLDRLDRITIDAGGRVNPYKDARMSAATFQRGFPEWQTLEALRDPAIISNFWRRTTGRMSVRPPALNINHAAKPRLHKTGVKVGKTAETLASSATGEAFDPS